MSNVLKSCKYCGKVHDSKYECSSRPKKDYHKNNEVFNKFRSSAQWVNKRNEIRQRDMHLCQVCLLNLHGTIKQHTSVGIQVHHIVSLAKDWNKRLDNDNLICLCYRHHDMADKGKISKKELFNIVK